MEKKLYRNEQEKMLAGVCAGLADYFDVDVTWVRIGFVVAVIAGLSGILAYIILWIAIPAKRYLPGQPVPDYRNYNADYRVYNESRQPDDFTAYQVPEPPNTSKRGNRSKNGGMIAGLILVCLGAYLLLDEFNIIPYWVDFDKLWPLVFIIPGILIISKSQRNDRRKADETQQPISPMATDTSSATADDTTLQQ